MARYSVAGKPTQESLFRSLLGMAMPMASPGMRSTKQLEALYRAMQRSRPGAVTTLTSSMEPGMAREYGLALEVLSKFPGAAREKIIPLLHQAYSLGEKGSQPLFRLIEQIGGRGGALSGTSTGRASEVLKYLLSVLPRR